MDPSNALVERAQAGDRRAFNELFRRHRSDVARIVHRMLGASPDAEDVIQEVFLNVYRSLPSFRGDSKFSTWLYRLSLNVTRMHLRRGRSRPRFADVEVPDTPRASRPPQSPEADVQRAERVRTLYRLLDTLSEKKREVLVLHDLEGMRAKDIADLVGAPVLTVRTRLFYARKELYAALAQEPSMADTLAILMEKLPGKPKRSEDLADADQDEPEEKSGRVLANATRAARSSSPEIDSPLEKTAT